MKSSNQHKIRSPEKLEEDMTDILWAAAAGAGLWGLAKGWDKWGKDAVASLPFASDKMKADAVDRQKEKRDKEVEIQKKLAATGDEKQKAKAAAKLDKLLTPDEKDEIAAAEKEKGEKERIKKGDLTPAEIAQKKIDKAAKASGEKDTLAKADELDVKNVGDAQAFFKKHDRAPAGYQEYPDDSGTVLDTKSVEIEKEKIAKKKEADAQAKADKERRDRDKAHADAKKNTETKLVPKGNKMTITESNELQAIMALGDEGIDAEINRKGQVVVKKKDLKKAQKALKKSFKKGGEPKLVGEELHRTAYELVSEARAKVIKNKPKWEPVDSEPRFS
jgi:hypothetical protein